MDWKAAFTMAIRVSQPRFSLSRLAAVDPQTCRLFGTDDSDRESAGRELPDLGPNVGPFSSLAPPVRILTLGSFDIYLAASPRSRLPRSWATLFPLL